MKNILLLFTLFTGLTGFSQDEKVTAPQIGIAIPLGETVLIDGITIQFTKVLEDSRCPKDVTCVWAGQAKVALTITQDGKTMDAVELLFGGTPRLIIAELKDFSIVGMALTPYPTSDTMGKLEYVLMVKKVAKN